MNILRHLKDFVLKHKKGYAKPDTPQEDEILIHEQFESSSSDKIYEVCVYKNAIICNCTAARNKTLCKHIKTILKQNYDFMEINTPHLVTIIEKIEDLKNSNLKKHLIADLSKKLYSQLVKDTPEKTYNTPLTKLPIDFCVIDIETTGLYPQNAEIIELSAIKVKNGVIIDEFSTLVKPSKSIPPKITAINNINDDMVKNAPSINTALISFCDFVEDEIILGYNVKFDIDFIKTACQSLNKSFNNDYFDVLELAKNNLNLNNYKLTTVANHFKIDTEGNHRGLKDCKITLDCYNNLNASLQPLQAQS